MIGLLLRLGIGPRWAKLIAYVGLPLLLAAAVWGYGALRYSAGYDQAEADQAERIAADRLVQSERERKADEGLRQQQTTDAAVARQRQQEIDNATRNLPDQAPSARQRSRACIELRRQATAAGGAQPAC